MSLPFACALVLSGCVLDNPGVPDARVYDMTDAARSTGFRDAGCGGGGPSGGSGSGGGSGYGFRAGSGASGRDCPADASVVGQPDATPVPDAAPACTHVRFRYENGAASSVWLSGTFTIPPWSPEPPGAYTLANDGSGVWTLDLDLAPGRYLYKLIIDGTNWITDPSNPLTETDQSGNVNSVIEVCGVR